ncbi:MAG: diaminopimelate decarboxylase [Caldisericia bacterium]|nr:diaminopimelate decarboxylase [Caldisericia bacterium]
MNTPYYLYREEVIERQIQQVHAFFSGSVYRCYFAVKSNANPVLLRYLHERGFGMDVISQGEWYAAHLAGVKGAEMIWNGNVKKEEEMSFFLDDKVGLVNIDSFREIEQWGRIHQTHHTTPSLFIRINPSIDAGTHPYISTGNKAHKFGIGTERLDEALDLAKSYSLRIDGLHAHIGSQITDPEILAKAYQEIILLSEAYGFPAVNLGGGWGIPYMDGNSLDLNTLRQLTLPYLTKLPVLCELGRYIVAQAGSYVVKVEDVRFIDQQHVMVITDGGMHHFIRPALYQAKHTFTVTQPSQAGFYQLSIMGRLCESGDILASGIDMVPEIGSLLYIHQAGAYGFSMASRYNGFPLPGEYLQKKSGETVCIRQPEEYNWSGTGGEHYGD